MVSYFGSICLDKIKEEFIKTGTDGKRYLSVYIGKRREVARDGSTHYVKAYVPKDRYNENENYFIGGVKEQDNG